MDNIDYVINKIKNECQNRKLAFWGGMEKNNKIRDRILSGLDAQVECYLSVHMHVVERGKNEDGTSILHIADLKNRADEYYIVAFPEQTDASDIMLQGYGFKGKDVTYVKRKTIVVTKGDYDDVFGNKVSKLPPNVKVMIDGNNNQISIGEVVCNEGLTIYCSGNSKVVIEDGVLFKEEYKMSLFDMTGEEELFPEIEIKTSCEFISGRISCFSGKIIFEQESTFGKNLQITCACGMKIAIGKKCMFSHDNVLVAGDGHLIFDCNTRECINSYQKLEKKKTIIIGEHVWVGWRAMLLNGAKIGNGAIIGANSLVKKEFPNNVIIAGSPAKIIRTDVAWSRHPVREIIELCGEEYINFTYQE